MRANSSNGRWFRRLCSSTARVGSSTLYVSNSSLKARSLSLYAPGSSLRVRRWPLNMGCSPLKVRNSSLNVCSSPLKVRSSSLNVGCSPLRVRSSPLNVGCSSLRVRSSPLKAAIPHQNLQFKIRLGISKKIAGSRPGTFHELLKNKAVMLSSAPEKRGRISQNHHINNTRRKNHETTPVF